MFSGLRERLGVGPSPVTGLNWGRNVIKLVAIVVVPFYVVWGVSQVGYYVWNLPEWLITTELGVGLSFWIAGLMTYQSYVKQQAAGYLSFPASKWRFSETHTAAIDLIVRDNDVEYIGKIGENSLQVYRLHLPFSIGYDHPQRGLLSFYQVLWLIPEEWDEQFFFKPGGEIWFGGFPISHARAEDISLHVYPYHKWLIEERELIPICLVHDSKLHYQATMGVLPERKKQQMGEIPSPDQINRAQISALVKDKIELKLEANVLQEELDSKLEESFDIKRTRERMIADHKRRYGNVLRAEEPWKWKLLNAKTLVFLALLVILIIVVYVYYIGPLMAGLLIPEILKREEAEEDDKVEILEKRWRQS